MFEVGMQVLPSHGYAPSAHWSPFWTDQTPWAARPWHNTTKLYEVLAPLASWVAPLNVIDPLGQSVAWTPSDVATIEGQSSLPGSELQPI
jgi:hypothetical protein